MTITSLERGQIKKEISIFLIITFAATSILVSVIYLISGPITFTPTKIWYISFQACMFIPAISAIICMVYFKSPSLTKETKIIFGFFILYVVIFSFESYFKPIMGIIYLPIVALHPASMDMPILSMILSVLGIFTVIIFNFKKKWRKNLEFSRLYFGKNLRTYFTIPLLISLIFIFTFILNYISGLGVPVKEFNLKLFFSTLIPSVILSFFILWPNYFGEEYGWRVYLQDRLFPFFGSYKGVLILGVIWGLWHAPLIIAGLNYPGQPLLGILLMIYSTILMGIIFSYAVLKTQSVWIAVLLHLILDTLFPVGSLYIAASINTVFSFGTGIYGFTILAVFALILLKSKVWKNYDNSVNL